MRYYYVGIPKNAAHPALAALFTSYLLSKEGQALLWQTASADLDTLPQSHSGALVADYEKNGAKMPEVTISWWGEHPEIDRTKAEMIKILSNK
jgi:ABC-type Fe3+ transport system substrate-binding protein